MTSETHFIGFKTPKDFLNALIGSRNTYKMLNILLTSILFGTIFTLAEEWLWSPMWTLLLFTVVCFLDFILAVTYSLLKGEGFKTSKALKFGVTLLALWTMLSIAHLLPKLVVAMEVEFLEPIIFTHFSKGLYFFLFFVKLASALKHASRLKILPKWAVAFFVRFIDRHKDAITAHVDGLDATSPGEKSKANGINKEA